MEVKIKIGGEIIDAKIVMMNGDMIVSPKVEKYEPKDGDVVTNIYNGIYQGTGISKVTFWKQMDTLAMLTTCVEKKKLVKLKWKPYEGGYFWLPYYDTMKFAPTKGMFNIGRDKSFLEKGWCFKTKEECQAFCDKLNQAIEGVKP